MQDIGVGTPAKTEDLMITDTGNDKEKFAESVTGRLLSNGGKGK